MIYLTIKKHNSKDNEWTSEPSMPSSRHRLALIAVDNQIYVIGRGPEAHITVSTTNQIFHVGEDENKMTSGSKLINMKKIIFFFIIFYQ